jgi:hypothetical protein
METRKINEKIQRAVDQTFPSNYCEGGIAR